MSTVHELLDPYSVRARLQPALLALLPLAVGLVVLLPNAVEPLRLGLIGLAAAGAALLLSQIIRDLGKQLEPKLYAGWGGKPSMAMLRHRDARVQAALKQRYHQRLGELLGRPLPTAAAELADPVSADAAYDACSAWLLAQGRDPGQHSVLFAHNIAYGFRRNLLAVKWWAIALAALAGGWIAAGLFWRLPTSPVSDLWAWFALAAIALYIIVMLTVVRRSWVRSMAEAYAIRLLEVVDRLPTARA